MLDSRKRGVLKMLRDAMRAAHVDRERRRRMEVEERVCEVCGGALDQLAAERIAKALDESPFWHEMRKEPELVGLLHERRPDIFAMAIGMEVCTACREKAHREGGWVSDSVAD
jgi:tRNA U54 and U55 pseudouridine synthase Pus10